jgi:phage-related protein
VAVIAGIAAGIALLGLAWTNNWGGIRDILTEVWETYLLPAFTEIKAWLDTNLPMAIAFLSDLWTNTLLPAIQTVVEWATTTLFPVLAEIARVVGEVVTAALQAHANFWENVLKPAIEIVWGFISGSVIPLLLELSNVSRAILGVALTALAGLWQNVLQPALQEVWKFIKGSVIPVIEDVARVIKNVLGPPASWLANTVLSGMKRSLDNVSSSIRKIINWLRELASKIRSLKLPSWLTPGSPTPLELGLIGIEGALKKANRTMGRSPLVGANGMSATAGGSPGGSVNHIEINVSGSGDPEAVASAILRKLRQQGVVP